MVDCYDGHGKCDIGSSRYVRCDDIEGGSYSQCVLLSNPIIYCRLASKEGLRPGNIEAGVIEVRPVNANQRKYRCVILTPKPDQSRRGLLNFGYALNSGKIVAVEDRGKAPVTHNDVCAPPKLVDIASKLRCCTGSREVYSDKQGDSQDDRYDGERGSGASFWKITIGYLGREQTIAFCFSWVEIATVPVLEGQVLSRAVEMTLWASVAVMLGRSDHRASRTVFLLYPQLQGRV